MKQYEAVILGGGMNGLSLALCLNRLKKKTLLIDRESYMITGSAQFDGRTTAVSQGMKRMLEALGVWEPLESASTPIKKIVIRDGASPLLLNFGDIENPEGPLGYIVDNYRIRQALQASALASPHLDIWNETTVQNFQRTSGHIILETSRGAASGAVLIGCDGRKSTVRTWARIRQKTWSYGQTALVFSVAHTKQHQHIAYECFYPAGPLAFLPMQRNHSQVVWSVEEKDAATLLALPATDFIQRLQSTFGDALGTLSLINQPLSFPLSFNHAYTYIADRVILMGDAAHGLHPIAGQGLNLGMRDVATFAEMIVDQNPSDLGGPQFLKYYDRRRKPDVLALIAATDGLNRLFGMSSPIIALPRKLGLGLVERVPRLKSFFTKNAMGLGDQMPRLFQGIPLTPP